MRLHASHAHASALLRAPNSAASRTSHQHQQLQASRYTPTNICHTSDQATLIVPPLLSHFRHTRGPPSTNCSVYGSAVACRCLHTHDHRSPPSLGLRRASKFQFRETLQRRGRCVPLAAVKQERLPPGQSSSVSSGDGGGGRLDRFFSSVTGFPFPIGPNFVRRTIRYEASPIRAPPCL